MAERRTSLRRWFGRGRTRALLSVGLLLGMGAVATSAKWTDQASFSAGSIDAGVMHIDLGANNKVKPESLAWPGPSLSNLAAGDSKAVMVPVTNNSVGDVRFSYKVEADASGTLGAALQVTVRRAGTSNGTTCSGGTLIGAADAPLDTFDQPAGANLAPAQAHNLCIAIKLPIGSSLPAQTSNITFRFPASQVP